jgi:hypothetical protein
LVTLGLKVAYYVEHPQDSLAERSQSALDSFMARNGWRYAGNHNLDVTGIVAARRYIGATCPGEVRVLVMDPAGDMTGIVDELPQANDQLMFVHDGVASRVPPDFAPAGYYLRGMLSKLRVLRARVSPYLALSAPAECHIATALPWSEW